MFTEYQRKSLDDLCKLIFREFSKTVGVAFLKLDCECIKLAGVSLAGEQTSPMMLISGKQPVIDEETKEEAHPVCEACSNDDLGIFRAKHHGMIWKDSKVKLTNQAKNKIKAKVFDSKFEKVR